MQPSPFAGAVIISLDPVAFRIDNEGGIGPVAIAVAGYQPMEAALEWDNPYRSGANKKTRP